MPRRAAVLLMIEPICDELNRWSVGAAAICLECGGVLDAEA